MAVAVDGVDTKLADMHGIDSWQALLLAIGLVRSRLEYFLESGGRIHWREEPSLEITGAWCQQPIYRCWLDLIFDRSRRCQRTNCKPSNDLWLNWEALVET
jgi:hypothetical protein